MVLHVNLRNHANRLLLAVGPTFINDVPAWIILEAKRLQRIKRLFSRLKKKPPTIIQMQPPQHRVVIMPPEEVCETPRPLQLFQARDHHIAHQLAQQLGYVILFREHDKYDMFGRSWVYWCLSQEATLKLLRCFQDLREAGEFTVQERIIINDLVNKGWMQKLNEGDKTYYYHLHSDTANMLSRQLARLLEQTQPAQNQVA